MPKLIEGKLVAKGMKFGIAASRFNDFICGRLIEGAVDALTRAGADEKDIHIYKVPGAFELPLVAKKLAKSGRFDAVICLEPSSGGQPRISNTSVQRFPRALPMSDWRRKFPLPLVY